MGGRKNYGLGLLEEPLDLRTVVERALHWVEEIRHGLIEAGAFVPS